VADAQVAQLVEHATENRSVGGSIPPLGTIPLHGVQSMSDENPGSRRTAVIALLAVIVIVLAGLWISGVLRGASTIQDCVMQGRSNC
jgi:hypothetical protein